MAAWQAKGRHKMHCTGGKGTRAEKVSMPGSGMATGSGRKKRAGQEGLAGCLSKGTW